MKLRIRNNSIRLRVTRSEVTKIRERMPVEAQVCFGPDANHLLKYRLEASNEVTSIQASYEENTICIRIPWQLARDWSNTEQIALQATQTPTLGADLKILIEKDFYCLKPRENETEDESDMYPNPAGNGTCSTHAI